MTYSISASGTQWNRGVPLSVPIQSILLSAPSFDPPFNVSPWLRVLNTERQSYRDLGFVSISTRWLVASVVAGLQHCVPYA